MNWLHGYEHIEFLKNSYKMQIEKDIDNFINEDDYTCIYPYNLQSKIDEITDDMRNVIDEDWYTVIVKYDHRYKINKNKKNIVDYGPKMLAYIREKKIKYQKYYKDMNTFWSELDKINVQISKAVGQKQNDSIKIPTAGKEVSWDEVGNTTYKLNSNDFININYELYNEKLISLDTLKNNLMPFLIGRVNKYYFSFYKHFRNELREQREMIINYRRYKFYECSIWGFSDVYDVFINCLNNCTEKDFAKYFRKALKIKFLNNLRNITRKHTVNNEFIIMQEINLDSNIKSDVIEQQIYVDNDLNNIEIKESIKTFINNYLLNNVEKTQYKLYKALFIMQLKKYTKTKMSELLNISTKTINKKLNKLQDMFKKYYFAY